MVNPHLLTIHFGGSPAADLQLGQPLAPPRGATAAVKGLDARGVVVLKLRGGTLQQVELVDVQIQRPGRFSRAST